MGGPNSGTPPSREQLEQAFALIDGGVSYREAARRSGLDRGTLAKYHENRHYRRKVRRCGECGCVVQMPCLRCSTDLKVAVLRRHKRRLGKAPRRIR